VVEKNLHKPPISVDEFLEKRVEPSDDHATRTAKAWAYLSCYPPMYTNRMETRPKELDLHPGVIVSLLMPPQEHEKDPLRICSSWDACSSGLLHFYRSRHCESNCHYHLYRVWKEMLEMGVEFSPKLCNLLALGNNSMYSIFNTDVCAYGDFFKLAMNAFAKNVLVGADIGRFAIVISDQAVIKARRMRSVREFDTRKSFRNVLSNWDTRGDPQFDMEGYQLYDEAKLLAPCIFAYLRNYSSKFKGGNILFKPCRMHSRAYYEQVADRIFDKVCTQESQVSYLSSPLLVSNWLAAIVYFENALVIHDFVGALGMDPNIEIVSITNQMKTQSLITVKLILKNLDLLGKPSESTLSSFFVELRLLFFWSWYFKLQTFRLEQISVCDPEQLLCSRIVRRRQ